MVTVSHLIQNIIQKRPLLQEAIMQNIISFSSLAEQLQPLIEKELNKKINLPAIVMALRRNSEKIKSKFKKFNYESEIIMKTNLIDIAIIKSSSLLLKLKKIHEIVDYERGDTLNIIHGNYEICIIINEKFEDKLKKILEDEKILNTEKNLVSLSLKFFSKDFFLTPGIIFEITRKLAWENVNILEIVSTFTELTFILSKKDAIKAYNVLQDLIEEKVYNI